MTFLYGQGDKAGIAQEDQELQHSTDDVAPCTSRRLRLGLRRPLCRGPACWSASAPVTAPARTGMGMGAAVEMGAGAGAASTSAVARLRMVGCR